MSFRLHFGSIAVEPELQAGAARVTDFFSGSWEGQESSEVEGKKSGGKAWMKCEPIGKKFGSACVLTSESAPKNPEHWFIGYQQKNDTYHIFIITPKSAHDHAAKWISKNEMHVTPIANNPDKCLVIGMGIKKTGDDILEFRGTEKNNDGKTVTFSVKLKRQS